MPFGRDTFWILKGLLVSGMRQTATGMLRNLISLAAAHGFVPNGARVYYLNRSQPPLLSAMVKLLVDANVDDSLLKEAYPVRAGLCWHAIGLRLLHLCPDVFCTCTGLFTGCM